VFGVSFFSMTSAGLALDLAVELSQGMKMQFGQQQRVEASRTTLLPS